MRAKMTASRHTIAAASADHVTFARYEFPRMEIVDVRADFDDFSNELVTDNQRTEIVRWPIRSSRRYEHRFRRCPS